MAKQISNNLNQLADYINRAPGYIKQIKDYKPLLNKWVTDFQDHFKPMLKKGGVRKFIFF